MDRGPISPNTHAAIEPFAALIVILSPWIFGYSATDDATTLAIVIGVAMLGTGLMTRWRYSIVDAISLRTHFAIDLVVSAVLILSPFVFGFSDAGGATRFFVIAGILEAITALSTRWNEAEVTARRRSDDRVARA